MTIVRPGRLGPITWSGVTVAGLPLDRLAALQRRVGGAFGHAGGGRGGGIEATGSLGLDQGVAVGARVAMRGFERAHLVTVVLDGVARPQLDQVQGVT